MRNSLNSLIGQDDIIAYFCTEFALHKALPIYSGGLGVLSGDIIMGASDMGLKVLGVGPLYKFGYLKQKINPSTRTQIEEHDEVDKSVLQEVKDGAGKPLIVNLKIKEPVKIKIWKLEVGRGVCYLLDTDLHVDTDLHENPPHMRDILSNLYPSDPIKRIQQEIILGIGGYYALKSMGIKPKLFHINEGHSAFLILARLKDLIEEEGLSFDAAKIFIRETTIFTTHTPVPAGNENFPVDLVKEYLGDFFDSKIMEKLLEEGFKDDDKKIFWLPAFAIRNSSYVNAVSKLHQETTKRMWSSIFKNLHHDEIPITYVTNGVHWRWLSEPFRNLLEKYIGSDFICMSPQDKNWDNIFKIPAREIWEAHIENKHILLSYLKKVIGVEGKVEKFPDVDDIIVTCARRMTGYKRNTLILYDQKRIAKILRKKNVVLIFSGKAHPRDEEGKKMIRKILEFREHHRLYDRVFFLENYDLQVAEYLLWGSDVWLNNPISPLEASGTSGMKASMNGVLHLSVLDGWWREGYKGDNGWAIFPAKGLPPYNRFEANQIYHILANEIYHLYYERDEDGIPRNWVSRMRSAMYISYKQFSINRVISEYVENLYAPALSSYEFLKKDSFLNLRKLVEEKDYILENWKGIKILNVYDKREDGIELTVELELSGLSPQSVEVQVTFIKEIIHNSSRGLEETRESSFKSFELPFKEYRDNKAVFYGFYPQSSIKHYSIRVVPKNPFIRRAYPDLIIWK